MNSIVFQTDSAFLTPKKDYVDEVYYRKSKGNGFCIE